MFQFPESSEIDNLVELLSGLLCSINAAGLSSRSFHGDGTDPALQLCQASIACLIQKDPELSGHEFCHIPGPSHPPAPF